MKDLILETKKIDWHKLKPYQPENFKKTTPVLMAKLKNSILKNGLSAPFYVWKKGKDFLIIDGHHRLDALKELETEGKAIAQASATFLNIKNDTEAKKIILAFNSHYAKITQNGFDDFIADLNIKEIELSFEPFNLNWKFDQVIVQEDNEDVVPEKIKPRAATGDIYEIRSPKGVVHRLICGDSQDRAVFDALMEDKKCMMVFTDPPYGVAIAAKNAMLDKIDKSAKSGRSLRPIISDAESPENLKKILLPCFQNIAYAMEDNASFYGTSPQGGGIGMMMMMMMMEAGLEIRHVLIWKKSSPAFSMNRLDYDYEHEPIFYTWKKSHVFHGKGQHKSSVWQIPKPSKSPLHPTMKPIELIENAILNSSLAGEIVLDAFTGSGSTLIACEKTGRSFRGVEIDPYYIDVILERLKQFSPECEIKKVNNG
jgi:DNA modification methylase